MAYLPHPKRNWTGYDPGNPDHVAALQVVKARRKWCAVWDEDFVVTYSTSKAGCEAQVRREMAGAHEAQADRARTLAWRRAQVDAYLAQRATRDSAKQLKMF